MFTERVLVRSPWQSRYRHKDVTFTLSSDPDATVQAHKNILTRWSSVFKAMFYGGLKEGATAEITNIKQGVFNKMIRFMERLKLQLKN